MIALGPMLEVSHEHSQAIQEEATRDEEDGSDGPKKSELDGHKKLTDSDEPDDTEVSHMAPSIIGGVINASHQRLAIEPWALRIACAVAVETNFPVVIFESDSKNLISCINDQNVQVPWEIDGDIEDIKDLGNVSAVVFCLVQP
ncbi:hypothetical protein RHMOL_Rhmol07G0083500 [Rhododendron molle]|uniref:Uncharacterized protein n=1 Tax=Rhododendron molle TaxID=49168 RepID=A0ACC0N0H0_RHOML|nr:hypothetical protein RHMOL_Rhmol07G0083500 [Rhododendron molle]